MRPDRPVEGRGLGAVAGAARARHRRGLRRHNRRSYLLGARDEDEEEGDPRLLAAERRLRALGVSRRRARLFRGQWLAESLNGVPESGESESEARPVR